MYVQVHVYVYVCTCMSMWEDVHIIICVYYVCVIFINIKNLCDCLKSINLLKHTSYMHLPPAYAFLITLLVISNGLNLIKAQIMTISYTGKQ